MKISEILDNIETGALQLPVFQRGYVWKEKQVKKLMQSLYRGFPVGSLLIWGTLSENVAIRGGQNSSSGPVNLLLDGQQRVTSLYGVIRGKPPQFFEGNDKIFTGLRFHLRKQEFEFYSPSKMALDPLWVDVTEFFTTGPAKIVELTTSGAYQPEELALFTERTMKIQSIKDIDIPDQRVTGEDKDTSVVVEIFNEINSNGTKLSSGDLVLARISSMWPDAREELRRCLEDWHKVGFAADYDTILRCIAAVADGSYSHDDLPNKSISEIKDKLSLTTVAINELLNTIEKYLGMRADKVHNIKQAFPIMVKYLVDHGLAHKIPVFRHFMGRSPNLWASR